MARAVQLANRARMSTNTTGQGTWTLANAVTGHQTFGQAGITNGQTIRYGAESSDGVDWEVGTGVYATPGPTLTRVTVYDSSVGGGKVSFTDGPQIWVDASKESFNFLDQSDTPTAYSGYGGPVAADPYRGASVGVNFGATALEFKYSTNVWIDIRDYGDISSGTITTALQATLVAIGTGAGKFKRILIPDIGIDLTCGAITWTSIGYVIGIGCKKLIFTSTLTPPAQTKIIGLNGRQSAVTGAIGQPGNHCLFKCDPGILVNTSNVTLENLVVEADGTGGGVGVKIFQADTCMIKHCNIGGLANAAKEALIVDELFWLDVQDSTFGADDGTPAILLTATESDAVTGTGLVRFQNICLVDGCIKIHALFGSSTTEGIYFDFVQHENIGAGASIIELDSTDVEITDCVFTNVLGADGTGTNYTLKNTGSNTKGIRIQCEDFAMDPTSTPIEDFEVITQAGVNSGDVTPSTAADHNQYIGYTWPSAIDKHNVASPRGVFSSPIGTVGSVTQDGTSWANESGSPTVTGSQIAPDGTTNAYKITGAGSGDARRLFGPSQAFGAFLAGDWLVAGCWIKSNSAALTAGGGAYIDFNDFGGTMDGFPAGQVPLGRVWGYGSVRHDGWVWFCTGVKCTTNSSNSGGPDLKLIASVGTSTKFYFNPCLQKIPATLGLSDMDVVNYIRSTSGGWSPSAVAGDIGILDHQQLLVRGKYVALQGKQTMWVPAASMTPRTTNGAAAASREINSITLGVLAFDQTTSEGANFSVTFPKSWNASTVTFRPHWTTASSTGTVKWDLRGGSFTDNTAINATGLGTKVGVTDTLQTVNCVHNGGTSSAVTLSNALVDVPTFFEISRDVADTLAADAELIGVEIFYTTSVGNDD